MTSTEPLLRLEHVSRRFPMGEVEVQALIDVSLTIRRGEFMTILGPSGSGKSTLLNIIGGADRPSDGAVWFDQTNLATLDDDALTRYRRESVGFIFQFYNLIPSLTAAENVQVACELVEDPVPVDESMALVELSDRMAHFPAQLSGGEQQRVAIARALSKRPRLLLADEPTGALDLPTAQRILGVLHDLSRQQDLTVVLITHNAAIGQMADRVVRLVSAQLAAVVDNDNPIPANEVVW